MGNWLTNVFFMIRSPSGALILDKGVSRQTRLPITLQQNTAIGYRSNASILNPPPSFN